MDVLNRKTFDLGLYDSDTGESIKAEKVVETRTKAGERMVLAYAKARRGPLVQLGFPYDDKPGGPTMGMTIHFFLNEMDPPRRAGDDTLYSMAHRVRMQRDELVAFLLANRPAHPPLSTTGRGSDG